MTESKTKISTSKIDIGNVCDPSRPILILSKEYEKAQVIKCHSHQRSQLIYAQTGVMSVSTEEGIWVVPPQRAVWVPAKTAHEVTLHSKISMRTLYILPNRNTTLEDRCFVANIDPLMRELILKASEFPTYYPLEGEEIRLMSVILDQVDKLSLIPINLPKPTDEKVKKVVDSLIADPSNQNSLAQWAEVTCTTSRTLGRLFQLDIGMNFSSMRKQIRLYKSLISLAKGDSITSVGLDLGYESVSAFISMFRKSFGISPSKYFKNPR